MTPFLRWAGSKRKILVDLNDYWCASEAQRYVEPFCGSACLFFHLSPEQALLNDSNRWLMHTYRTIRDYPKSVSDRLRSLVRSKQIYDKIRSVHFEKFSEINKAAYFIYLNRLCFNGLYRTNKSGYYNVPFSNSKTGKMPDYEVLVEVAKALGNAELANEDFFQFVQNNVRAGDFVYLDPPYAVSNVRMFRQYDGASFGLDDLSRLFDALELIDRNGAKFVLSYADSPEIIPALDLWPSTRLEVRRNISGFAKSRRKANEVLISNV